ncbi:MAG TPA: BMP family ABC transporter substrate-binding protein [Candidatus Limnocylindria bacterium]|nr:BMP family ABC transporter substrate-binding protein [Candidatus Limnocylindria bacterium]
MRKQRWLGASAALVSLMLVLAACNGGGESAGESAAESAAESAGGSVAPAGFKVCMVTDTGGVDDKGFNQNAYEGVTRAGSELGVETALLESTADTDYAPNLAAFTDQNCDLIVTVGFLLGSATQASAATNPDQLYTIVDFAYDPAPPNILGLVFDTKSASMLQGYLAAGTSTTGIVGTFGGIQIGPVVDFMNGFAAGINYYNQEKGTDVKLLGWDPATQTGSFTGDFEDQDKGRQTADGLMQEGADIIFAVAGPVGIGAMAAVEDNGAGIDPAPMFIGVDVDQYISVPGYESIMLSSVLKRMDNAVFDAIETAMGLDGASAWPETLYVGTLENDGVGMADFHDLASVVSDELSGEIDALKAALIDGSVTADAFSGQPPASAAP